MIDDANIFANDLVGDGTFFSRAKDWILNLKQSFINGKIPGESCSFLHPWMKCLTLRKGFLYCFTGMAGIREI